MRLLVTKGPHKGQVLDFGSAQGAAALRDGWVREPEPHGFLPATPGLVEFGAGRVVVLAGPPEQVIPVTPPNVTAADIAAQMPAALAEVGQFGADLRQALAEYGVPEPVADHAAELALEEANAIERSLARDREAPAAPDVSKRRKRS